MDRYLIYYVTTVNFLMDISCEIPGKLLRLVTVFLGEGRSNSPIHRHRFQLGVIKDNAITLDE